MVRRRPQGPIKRAYNAGELHRCAVGKHLYIPGMSRDDWIDFDRPDLPPEAGNVDDELFDPNNDWLEGADEDLQIEAMRRWFLARYEDPAQNTPYNGREGGYLYVHGGPFHPDEEIQVRFGEIVPYEVMEELIDELHQEVGDSWAPIQRYDDDLSYVVDDRGEPCRHLHDRLSQIDAVLRVQADPCQSELIHQMAHGSLIAALEAYLAETVTYQVMQDEQVMRRFVSQNKDFKSRTLTLNELFERLDALKQEVTHYLQNQMWHRLDKIKPMMEAGLRIKMPEIDELMREVVIRHDIVHRAGRTRDGDRVQVSADDVRRLRGMVESFAGAVEAALQSQPAIEHPSRPGTE